ncbi:MAG: radical SAM protein [Thermoleophilia bacterium]
MSIHLRGIHFLVTYRCTYACEHCFVWGSPSAEATMTLTQLRSVIDQAAAGGVTGVYFEGGEPTLAYPIVLAAARQARRRGLSVGMVSNCFWATSVEDAEVWLAPFVDLGISDLSLSSYAYSVEDVDATRLRNAVLAARKLGLPMDVLEVGAPAGLDVPGVCSGEVSGVMYKGRAAVELAPGRAARPPETLTTCPFEDFADPGRAHVGPDGELQICQGVSAGNVFAGGDGPPALADLAAPRVDGLAAVLAAYDPHARPVVRELLAGGPWALAQAVGHTPERELYADECHLCYEVRAALRSAGRYPEVVAPGQCYAENESEEERCRPTVHASGSGTPTP